MKKDEQKEARQNDVMATTSSSSKIVASITVTNRNLINNW